MSNVAIDPTQNLPTDAASLRALLLSTLDAQDAMTAERDTVVAERDTISAERDAMTAERDALALQNDRLRHLLLKLKRLKFGARSERLPDAQLQFAIDDLETAVEQAQAEAEKSSPALKRERTQARRASRGALPAHLPRVEVMVAPDDTNCPCCRAAMRVIGEDSSERLDVVPAQFRVIVTRRPKLACRSCAGTVVQAHAPARLIEGGLPTEALVAHVLVSRYADHLPLYRQAQIIARGGVELDRSTLAAWVGTAAAEVAPVVHRLKQIVMASARVFADETVVPVLDPGRGRTKQGYFWTVARDDRPWGGSDPPAVVYSYAPGRGQQHARTLLGNYRGILQCDGYAAYKQLARAADGANGATLVFCWSHVRRGFYDLAKTGTAPIATEALARIAELYRIEAAMRGEDAHIRYAKRQAESRPLVSDLRAWFERQFGKLPGRSPTAEAIRYALNHWDGLVRFLDNGRIDLDTNSVERAIRPIALSRKNALFAGSDEGGENWAAIASLIETCKLNSVEPQAYITGLLTCLVGGWKQARIEELMPWCWKPTIKD